MSRLTSSNHIEIKSADSVALALLKIRNINKYVEGRIIRGGVKMARNLNFLEKDDNEVDGSTVKEKED